MTRYNKSMREVLFRFEKDILQRKSKWQSVLQTDPRYKGGNYDGAVDAIIEKIKKGLSNHKQVSCSSEKTKHWF